MGNRICIPRPHHDDGHIISIALMEPSRDRVVSSSSHGMHFTNILAIGALVTYSVAAPAPSAHVLHEKRDRPLRMWAKRDRVDPSIVLPVRIGLTQGNLDKGPSLLDEV